MTPSTGRVKILVLNVWGLQHLADDKSARVAALAEHLRQSDYDIVLLQELWYNTDFQTIKVGTPWEQHDGQGYLGKIPVCATKNTLIGVWLSLIKILRLLQYYQDSFPYSVTNSLTLPGQFPLLYH